jgi:hypothetical protein
VQFVLDICDLLGYYAASSGDPLATFRDHVLDPSSSVKKSRETLKDRIHTWSQNVDKGLPLDAAYYPRRSQISSISRRKPEITFSLLLAKTITPEIYHTRTEQNLYAAAAAAAAVVVVVVVVVVVGGGGGGGGLVAAVSVVVVAPLYSNNNNNNNNKV